MRNEVAPQVHGETGIKATEANDEVILPSGNGSFSSIAAMLVRRHKLEVDGIGMHESFEVTGGFVVKSVEVGLQTAAGTIVMHLGVATKKFSFGARLEQAGEDDIGVVVVVDDHDIFATFAGSDWEMTSLVAVGLASDLDDLHEYIIGAGFGLAGCCCWDWHGRGNCGGANVLALLAKVSFCSGYRLDEVLADEVDREAGPGGEESRVDSFEPSGWDWAEAGVVQVVDNVLLDDEFVDIAVGTGFDTGWSGGWGDGRAQCRGSCRPSCQRPVAGS
jgi:hypothetical protein